jgi:hypothetical protein
MPNPRHGGINVKHHTKFCHLLTGLLPILVAVLAVGGLLVGAQLASAATANNCVQDLFGRQKLQCTANDVSIAEVTNISISSGGQCTGTPPNQTCTCNSPGNVTFTADFKVVLTAQERFDIGFFIGTDGDPNGDGALTGQCQAFVITQAEEEDANGNPFPSNFVNSDGDSCGNIDATHNPQFLQLTVTTACVGDPVTGKLKLPTCTTWQQPGADTVCSGPPSLPGSPSKCNCNPGFTVNILVEHPTISVTKTPTPTHITEGTPTDVTYAVQVTNDGSSASVSITSLTDNLYGNITTTGHNGITSTTCGPTPITIPPDGQSGNPYSCSFTVTGVEGEAGQSITDTVCASGTDANGGTVGPTCGTAIVTVDDVKPTATLIKTVQSANCAQVQYQVQVVNTDTVDVLTLNALCDDTFGDISAGHNSFPACNGAPKAVIGTPTCVVPQTLQPYDGVVGGTDTYTCTFVGLACVGDTDTVTATLHDDEGNPVTKSGSATLTNVTVTGTHNP